MKGRDEETEQRFWFEVGRTIADRVPDSAEQAAVLAAGAGAGIAGFAAREIMEALLATSRGAALESPRLEGLLPAAVEGALYARLLEPRLPGPPWVQGVLLGLASRGAAPHGGLRKLLEPWAPWGTALLPGSPIRSTPSRPRSLAGDLAWGVAVAAVYGLFAKRRGAERSAGAGTGSRRSPER